jgi:hypothetical protein
MRWWKVLGAAAFVGVAAGGVLIARDERRRQAYTPDEVRERLHARAAEAEADARAAAAAASPQPRTAREERWLGTASRISSPTRRPHVVT